MGHGFGHRLLGSKTHPPRLMQLCGSCCCRPEAARIVLCSQEGTNILLWVLTECFYPRDPSTEPIGNAIALPDCLLGCDPINGQVLVYMTCVKAHA